MSFLMTIDEYRRYLSSDISIPKAFASNGKIAPEMLPQFRQFFDRSGDILLKLTLLAKWSEYNKGPGKTTPGKKNPEQKTLTTLHLLQDIRSKVCKLSTGNSFGEGYYMVRYILATNHYSLPWIC